MKKTLYLTPCISLAAIAPICSCSPSTTSAEAIANAIFGPTDITPATLSTSFADALKSMSSEERKNELVYDLFNRFNQPIDSLDKTIKQLYVDNVVGINTNINTNFFSLEFNQDKLIANFLGSVSFVFLNDYDANHKTNDYIMFTYDIKNIEVGIDETNYFLTYKDEGHIIGIEKIRSFDGEHMNSIEAIDQPIDSLPKNSKNWVKQ